MDFLPLNISNCHWALLVADVCNTTVGVVDSLTTNATVHAVVLRQWSEFMRQRAEVTAELGSWQECQYTMRVQTDGSSCGILTLMAAEALIKGVSTAVIDPGDASYYRRYVRTRLVCESRPYKVDDDSVCDMPFCLEPTGRISWIQCVQCSRWFHVTCVNVKKVPKKFLCIFCS